jgi:hypothetical protein
MIDVYTELLGGDSGEGSEASTEASGYLKQNVNVRNGNNIKHNYKNHIIMLPILIILSPNWIKSIPSQELSQRSLLSLLSLSTCFVCISMEERL